MFCLCSFVLRLAYCSATDIGSVFIYIANVYTHTWSSANSTFVWHIMYMFKNTYLVWDFHLDRVTFKIISSNLEVVMCKVWNDGPKPVLQRSPTWNHLALTPFMSSVYYLYIFKRFLFSLYFKIMHFLILYILKIKLWTSEQTKCFYFTIYCWYEIISKIMILNIGWTNSCLEPQQTLGWSLDKPQWHWKLLLNDVTVLFQPLAVFHFMFIIMSKHFPPTRLSLHLEFLYLNIFS